MPERQEAAVVTCVAGTPSTNPTMVPLGFDGGTLRVIRILIPAGHAGLTGIALGYGSNPTVPFGRFAYYSGDDREVIIAYSDRQPGVSWAAFVCNNDLIDHQWEVDMDFDDSDATNATSSIAPLSSANILAAGEAAMIGP